MISELQENLNVFDLNEMCLNTLVIESVSLQNNPLKDPSRRKIPVLYPKDKSQKWPVIFYLSGYSSNGAKFFNFQSFEESSAAQLLKMIEQKQAPKAIYVFVDAWTYWGGSQFINSLGCGKYEDYIVKELVPQVKHHFACTEDPKNWFVTGASSGGYGALHLASKFPQIFANVAAVAPDCFFQLSLLPEIYSVFPYIQNWGGIEYAKKELEEGKFLKRRVAHKILNVIAMALCYGGNESGKISWPINPEGVILENIWENWLEFDPLVFLPERCESIKVLDQIYLDVGIYDQFHLQYGTRQLYNQLMKLNAKVTLTEYKGSHFDLGTRRAPVWNWIYNVVTHS
jgi:enterochelin esterase family protein